jgi:hypothetical protein
MKVIAARTLEFAMVGLCVAAAACAGYDTDRAWNERMVTVTGCVQAVRGSDRFVLSDVGKAEGASPEAWQTYVLEGAADLADKVGRQTRVRGQLTATLEGDGRPRHRPPTIDELGRLRVQRLETMDGTCATRWEPKG